MTNGDASGEESDEEETSKTDCKPVAGTQHSEEEDENEVRRFLIPRQFPPPVFDRLQCGNTEGEGLGDLVLCNDIR